MRIAKIMAIMTIALLSFLREASSLENTSHFFRKNDSSSLIVFIHGVLEDITNTWTASNGAYWPELLTHDTDFDKFDIYVYNYSANLTSKLTISELAIQTRAEFISSKILNYKEIVFVAHSMGGVIVRQLLLNDRDLASRTRFVYFFATPTTGSSYANVLTKFYNSSQISRLQSSAPEGYLGDLQRDWFEAKLGVLSYCAYEKLKEYGLPIVVSEESASNLCNSLQAIEADHSTIAKPLDLNSEPHIALRAALLSLKKAPVSLEGNLLSKPEGVLIRNRTGGSIEDTPIRCNKTSDYLLDNEGQIKHSRIEKNSNTNLPHDCGAE